MRGSILGAALGSCVHVGGLHHFLKTAEAEGYSTTSLGPAVPVARLLEEIRTRKPDLVALSYRLTPEVARTLFEEVKSSLGPQELSSLRFVFGGTPPVAEVAGRSGLFEKTFSGLEPVEDIRAYLHGGTKGTTATSFASNLIERIEQKYPYPLLRHHFGRPSLQETLDGVKTIAMSGVLDVISLGPDQNAQEHFFRPDQMDPAHDGAGGVPVRKADDLRALYENSRCGNFPLMRCYSGTRDLLKWAAMSVAAIHNAWAAIPLCWYSVMDGRSDVLLHDAIREKQEAMRWYAERGIPVEVNESHQWSLRDAHDSLAVTMAFLAAYNAKKAGVRNYVAQYMFNTPPGMSPAMDIAKMLAKKEMIEGLQDATFTAYREVRAGIAHFASIPAIAQGQLAASAVVSLSLKPHILHVVGFSEGDHATFPEELIHSCNIVHGVLHNCLQGLPDPESDPAVRGRKEELIGEAKVLLEALRTYGASASEDPWSDPDVLSGAIKIGLLDAPHFRGNPHLCGTITTRLIDGAWYAIAEATGGPVGEQTRTTRILEKEPLFTPQAQN